MSTWRLFRVPDTEHPIHLQSPRGLFEGNGIIRVDHFYPTHLLHLAELAGAGANPDGGDPPMVPACGAKDHLVSAPGWEDFLALHCPRCFLAWASILEKAPATAATLLAATTDPINPDMGTRFDFGTVHASPARGDHAPPPPANHTPTLTIPWARSSCGCLTASASAHRLFARVLCALPDAPPPRHWCVWNHRGQLLAHGTAPNLALACAAAWDALRLLP